MKKIIYTMGVALVMLASVSCKKNSIVNEPEKEAQPTGVMRSVTITASQGETKISVSGGKHIWSKGEKINIMPASGGFGVASLDIVDGIGSASGTFDGKMDSGIKEDTPLYAWIDEDNWIYEDGEFKYLMSPYQVYAENVDDVKIPLMGAGSIKDGISFKKLFGILCLDVKSDPEYVLERLEVRSESHNISGLFSVNPSKFTTGGYEGKYLMVDCRRGVSLPKSGTKIYVVIPARTYRTNDLTVKLNMSDYSEFEFKLDAVTITAGSVTTVIMDEMTPTSGVERRTGGELVNWVRLWRGGPKWAEYNIGATSVGEYGGHYCWSGITDKDPLGEYYWNEEDIQHGDNDTAKKLWGSDWQMPTKADYDALLSNCEAEWTDNYKGLGVAGVVYTGKGVYSENSVFFPAAGLYDPLNREEVFGSFGDYWCSTPDGERIAFYMSFSYNDFQGYYQGINNFYRYYGRSVRAILAE
ncbi:MAG: hypothetical protein MJ010_07375 [Paludibacteraceae bacterium]|nr:hypothetical protein [Paludibacteraceae bacterium]